MAVIEWSDIVGTEQTIEDGGHVGDLLAVARAHVDDAVTKNRLTQAQAGEIYTAMIPAAFQAGLKFGMEEQLAAEKVNTEALNQEAIIAKVRDENGMTISESGNNQPYTGEDTQHSQIIKKLKAEVTLAGTDNELKTVQKIKDYGSDNAETLDDATGIPQSRWEADMYKAYREAQIGDETVKGFAADAYYKNAKLSQETLFALANAGVITGTEAATADVTDEISDPYTFFATKLKESLVNQIEVFVPTPEGSGG